MLQTVFLVLSNKQLSNKPPPSNTFLKSTFPGTLPFYFPLTNNLFCFSFPERPPHLIPVSCVCSLARNTSYSVKHLVKLWHYIYGFNLNLKILSFWPISKIEYVLSRSKTIRITTPNTYSILMALWCSLLTPSISNDWNTSEIQSTIQFSEKKWGKGRNLWGVCDA